MAKKPAKPAIAAEVQPLVPPPPPAIFCNHTRVSWSEGVVRLTFGDQQGDTAEPRAAVVITAAQARDLRDILGQAVGALTPHGE